MKFKFRKSLFLVIIISAFMVFAACKEKLKRSPKTIRAVYETIVVNGKKARVFNLVQPGGRRGFSGKKGDYFNVILKNDTDVPISIHWHGSILPNDQDGVPYVTQLPIKPGETRHYFYKLKQAGTYWMHSHYKFHEQKLMSAPFIIKDPNDPYKKDKNIVVMLQGFTFADPEEIFQHLRHPETADIFSSPAMHMKDLNDVTFDAMLANRHTLQNPKIYKVKPGQTVRLRMINAASASNFWVDTGSLEGRAIAVDGNDIQPIKDRKFQIAIAQRMDIEVIIPKEGGAFPILAQAEGTRQRAGVILATRGAAVPRLSELADTVAPALNDDQELRLHPLKKTLPDRPVTTVLNYSLEGSMKNYIWTMNKQAWPLIDPLKIKEGDRVEMIYTNNTNMSHPMHFHGHVFQVTSIDGKPISDGPMRDTILVLPHSTKKIIYDADNPGIWMNHCHVLYHMAAGMMTTTNYENYKAPVFYKKLIHGWLKESEAP